MSSPNPHGYRYLHWFALFTALCTFILVIAGGLVTSTGSGLAVPDWPLSYGQVMPPMTGGIVYEHSHRLIATFVGALTVILAIWLSRKETRRWVRMLGWVAVGAVVLQGLLGGLTVLLLLPTPVSVLHASLAQIFFSLTVVLALVTSRTWHTASTVDFAPAARTRMLAVMMSAAVLLQLVLGAWMRHSDAGLAITDFPLAYGSLLPPASNAQLEPVNYGRIEQGLAPVQLSQVWIHFAHRLGALLTAVIIGIGGAHIFKTYHDEKRLRRLTGVILGLVLLQIALGALTVWTAKSVHVTTTHVAVGALLLATSVVITVRTFHLFRVPARSRSMAAKPEPART